MGKTKVLVEVTTCSNDRGVNIRSFKVIVEFDRDMISHIREKVKDEISREEWIGEINIISFIDIE